MPTIGRADEAAERRRIVLMSAMPAAAALPVRKRVGSAQNGPRVPRSPTAATVSAIMPGNGDVK